MPAGTEIYRAMSVKPLAVLAIMIAVSTPDAAQTAVPPDGAPSSETVQYQECDGNQCDTGNPGTWTFRGASGEARWPSGAKAALTLESSGDGNITVRRVDTSDSTSQGFTAVYRGTLRNGRYEGTVDASWPGHFRQGVVHYSWSATVMPGQPQPSRASTQPTRPSESGAPPSGPGAGTQAASPSVAVASQGPTSVLQGPAQMAGILEAPAPFTAVRSLPKQMRFCDNFCFRLTLANDHYEAVQEGSTDGAVGSIYSVVRFSPQAIEFYRNDANRQFAILTGRMSSDGNRLVDGSIAWYQPDGSSNTVTGVALTWGLALMEARASAAAANPALGPTQPSKPTFTPPDPTHPGSPTGTAVGDYFYNQVEQMRARPVPTDISLPRGASPFFKSYPDDIRAVLQPEFPLAPELHELSCDSQLNVTGNEALEIGRYALRAGEFLRARCWLERGARTKNIRANEVLAISYLMGWGVKQNQAVGFLWILNLWKSSRDLWSYHFLAQCLRYGVGTPVDIHTAARLEQALMADPSGRALILSIGADDAEQRREFARLDLLMFPPMRTQRVCKHGEPCRDDTVIDQDEYNRKLQAIDTGQAN
jgi:hypothetical protein